MNNMEAQLNPSELVQRYRAEYENACDDLYYGYGYTFWRHHYNSIESDEEAKIVWKAAFNHMAS